MLHIMILYYTLYLGVRNWDLQHSQNKILISVCLCTPGTCTIKKTLSRASLQKIKSAKHILQQWKTYKYWSSFDKNYNASVMKLKKSSIIVIPTGAQDPNLKKSAWFFHVLLPWQCPFKSLLTLCYLHCNLPHKLSCLTTHKTHRWRGNLQENQLNKMEIIFMYN